MPGARLIENSVSYNQYFIKFEVDLGKVSCEAADLGLVNVLAAAAVEHLMKVHGEEIDAIIVNKDSPCTKEYKIYAKNRAIEVKVGTNRVGSYWIHVSVEETKLINPCEIALNILARFTDKVVKHEHEDGNSKDTGASA